MKQIESLFDTYNKLYEELDNDNYDVEDEVYELEDEVRLLLDEYSFQDEPMFENQETELIKLRELNSLVKEMKQEFDFYDEESELDMMFPNRHDDDFDEDDMSWRNVFGE